MAGAVGFEPTGLLAQAARLEVGCFKPLRPHPPAGCRLKAASQLLRASASGLSYLSSPRAPVGTDRPGSVFPVHVKQPFGAGNYRPSTHMPYIGELSNKNRLAWANYSVALTERHQLGFP